ncbi:WYL domain-containing protein [Riemerella columbipharyngis]|uniref:WYL domain-containing protein n=1 Tax=Riemerella columbipharyngis TaxID=1071918 RepID=A0A1G7BJY4_9FLAO|nr:WYL domain-containing protein [Riemerella columbipharyngis]SDE26746.1 WYL domain-containing protein [Riemerella columbipharyngis]
MHFENRICRGIGENLNGLVHAIKNRKIVSFLHQSLWNNEDKPSKKVVQPYALKEFRYRWYLLGKEVVNGTVKELKIYGLNRMADLKISASKFSREKINIG